MYQVSGSSVWDPWSQLRWWSRERTRQPRPPTSLPGRGHCGTLWDTNRTSSLCISRPQILLLTIKHNAFCKKFLRSLLVLSMLRRMAQGVDSVTTPTAALQSASPQPLQSSLQPHLEQGRYLGLTDRDKHIILYIYDIHIYFIQH